MPREKTEKDFLEEISLKLDKLITLIGMSGEFNKTHLKKLYKHGFNQYELQRVTGMDQGDISRELRGVKKKPKKNDK